MSDIGSLLKARREQFGLSQTELADVLTESLGKNFFHTTIGKMERGTREITFVEAVELSKILKFSLNDLAESVDHEPELSDKELAEFMEIYANSPILYEVV